MNNFSRLICVQSYYFFLASKRVLGVLRTRFSDNAVWIQGEGVDFDQF
jgi:hypothetical protein